MAAPLLVRLPRALPAVAFGGVMVQPRAAWGADLAPKGPLPEEVSGDVRFLLVHHTASPNGYAEGAVPGLLRGFYGLHTSDRQWADIAYNFLVDRFGRVWEGRTGSLDGPVMVNATGGSQGFAQLACFIGDHTAEPPTPAALDAMGSLLGALANRYGIDVRPGTKATFVSRGSNLHPVGKQVTTSTIAGHRDMSKTACPGDACFRLIPSQLVPSAVVAAGAGAPAAPPTSRPPSSGRNPVARPAEPQATPSTGVQNETLPAANPGGLPLDRGPAPSFAPPPTELSGGATPAQGSGGLILAGVAAGVVTAAGALVGLVLRRRGNGRESEHWERARLKEVDATLEPPREREESGSG